MDGTDYTQSTALLRYAGKLGGTYPECPLAALKVDEIVMIAEDVFINLFSTMGKKDEAKKVNALGHVNGSRSPKQTVPAIVTPRRLITVTERFTASVTKTILVTGKLTVTVTVMVTIAATEMLSSTLTVVATLMVTETVSAVATVPVVVISNGLKTSSVAIVVMVLR